MPDRSEIDRAIEAVLATTELQDGGFKQRRALKLLDQAVWAGTVTAFHQARAEQRINTHIRALWHTASLERVANPKE